VPWSSLVEGHKASYRPYMNYLYYCPNLYTYTTHLGGHKPSSLSAKELLCCVYLGTTCATTIDIQPLLCYLRPIEMYYKIFEPHFAIFMSAEEALRLELPTKLVRSYWCGWCQRIHCQFNKTPKP